MKKILSILLVLCMCCAIPAAFAEETASGFLGLWELVRYVQGELELDKEMLKESQGSWTLELKEDGTFHSVTVTGETDGTWTEADGTLELTFTEDFIYRAEPVDDQLHVVFDIGDGTLAEYYLARPES